MRDSQQADPSLKNYNAYKKRMKSAYAGKVPVPSFIKQNAAVKQRYANDHPDLDIN
jgi:hypothetical protein